MFRRSAQYFTGPGNRRADYSEDEGVCGGVCGGDGGVIGSLDLDNGVGNSPKSIEIE
jgi:hypothetical protein